MTVITAPAISRCVSGPASVWNFHRPTIRGRQVSLVVTSSGHRKAFQEPMKREDDHSHHGRFAERQDDLHQEA